MEMKGQKFQIQKYGISVDLGPKIIGRALCMIELGVTSWEPRTRTLHPEIKVKHTTYTKQLPPPPPPPPNLESERRAL